MVGVASLVHREAEEEGCVKLTPVASVLKRHLRVVGRGLVRVIGLQIWFALASKEKIRIQFLYRAAITIVANDFRLKFKC